MRVAIDGAPLGSGRGGDETLLAGILSGLAEVAGEDDAFSLFLPADAELPLGLRDHPAFSVLRVGRHPGALRLSLTLPAALARVRPRPDLVFGIPHVPLWSPSDTVVMVTDLSFHHHPHHYPPATRARLNLLVPRQARAARLVVTLSEFCRQDLIETYGLSADRVAVVPCAVDAPTPLDEVETSRLEAWASEAGVRPPFILYLGNLHPRKNLSRLIQAFDRARRTDPAMGAHRLVVAGARWWGDEGEAVRSVSEGAVVFLGRVDELQREFLLRRAELLAYPSLFEGFGLPPLEAMARGTPVLASRAGAIPEVSGEAALLVDPYDVDSVADGLVRLAGDSRLRDRLRQRGLERAAGFDPRRTGWAALRAFRSALAEEAGAPSR